MANQKAAGKKAPAKNTWKNRIVGQGEQPADQFMANSANFRRHPNTQRNAMRGALSEIGWIQRVVVNRRTGNLIDGHLRIEEALSRGDKTPVPYIEVDLSKHEEKLALAILDPISAMATADKEALDLLLQEVSTGDEGLQAMLAELASENGLYFGDQPKESEEDESAVAEIIDKAAELQKKWKVKRGDVWAIGEHRLMCGDSTSPEDVGLLMDGEKAELMNTDPPYGIDMVGLKDGIPDTGMRDLRARHGDVVNDDLTDGVKLQEFLEASIRAAVPHLVKKAAFYLWHPMLTQGTFFAAAAAAAAADILIHRQIIWVKPSLVLTRSGMYHWKHELCFYGWVRGNMPNWYGDKSQTSVWECGRDSDAGLHPTQKPIELFVRPIKNHTKEGEIAYEPFAGSGSQIVAAESTRRRCFALELAESRCAVILERMTLAFPGTHIERITKGKR